MKLKILLVTTLISTSFGWALENAKIENDSKSDFTFKNKDGQAVTLRANDFASKKAVTLALAPAKTLANSVLKDKFNITLTIDKDQFLFETLQKTGDMEQNGSKKRVVFFSTEANAETIQKYAINCVETSKITDSDDKSEIKHPIACIKNENCTSYSVKDATTFELISTPICVGKKEASFTKKIASSVLSCKIYLTNNNFLKVTQLGSQQSIEELKSSEKCL